MSLKKLGIGVLAVLAFGAIFANSALAGKTVTKTASWTAAGKSLTTNVNEAVKCKKTAASPNFVLKGTVAGAATELTATGVECTEAFLVNKVEGTNMARATGKITFTGVTVVKPEGCKTAAVQKTNLLEGDLKMDTTVATKSFFEFKPDAAAGQTNFTNVKLEECAAEGNYPVKGFTVCEATNATGVEVVTQECNGDTTTNSMSGLTLGGNAATITGEIAVELNGANAGASWGAQEK